MGLDPELPFLAKKFDLPVKEIAVEWAHDEQSKTNPVTDGLKMFCEMLVIRWGDLRGH